MMRRRLTNGFQGAPCGAFRLESSQTSPAADATHFKLPPPPHPLLSWWWLGPWLLMCGSVTVASLRVTRSFDDKFENIRADLHVHRKLATTEVIEAVTAPVSNLGGAIQSAATLAMGPKAAAITALASAATSALEDRRNSRA